MWRALLAGTQLYGAARPRKHLAWKRRTALKQRSGAFGVAGRPRKHRRAKLVLAVDGGVGADDSNISDVVEVSDRAGNGDSPEHLCAPAPSAQSSLKLRSAVSVQNISRDNEFPQNSKFEVFGNDGQNDFSSSRDIPFELNCILGQHRLHRQQRLPRQQLLWLPDLWQHLNGWPDLDLRPTKA